MHKHDVRLRLSRIRTWYHVVSCNLTIYHAYASTYHACIGEVNHTLVWVCDVWGIMRIWTYHVSHDCMYQITYQLTYQTYQIMYQVHISLCTEEL